MTLYQRHSQQCEVICPISKTLTYVPAAALAAIKIIQQKPLEAALSQDTRIPLSGSLRCSPSGNPFDGPSWTISAMHEHGQPEQGSLPHPALSSFAPLPSAPALPPDFPRRDVAGPAPPVGAPPGISVAPVAVCAAAPAARPAVLQQPPGGPGLGWSAAAAAGSGGGSGPLWCPALADPARHLSSHNLADLLRDTEDAARASYQSAMAEPSPGAHPPVSGVAATPSGCDSAQPTLLEVSSLNSVGVLSHRLV